MKRIKNWEGSSSHELRRLKRVGLILGSAVVVAVLLLVGLGRSGLFLGLFGGVCAVVVALLVSMHTHPRNYPDMVLDGRLLQIPVPYATALDITQPYEASYIVPKTITQYVYENLDGGRTMGGQQLPWAILRVVQGGRVFSFFQRYGCDPFDVGSGVRTAHATPLLEGMTVHCNIGPLKDVFFAEHPIHGGAYAPPASFLPGTPPIQSPASAPLGPTGPASPSGLFTDGGPQTARLVVAPDYGFAKLQQSLEGLRLRTVEVGAEAASGEPTTAQWQSESSRVAYHFDPRTALRRMEITGGDPTYLRNDLLNISYLPTVQAYTLNTALQSSDHREVLHAVGAAAFIGSEGEPQHLLPSLQMVAVLHEKTSPEIAAAARGAVGTLESAFRRQGKL